MPEVAALASRHPGRSLGFVAALLMLGACSKSAPPTTAGGIEAAPLRTASGQESPRFRLLPPSDSGLQFTNVLHQANTYQYLANGAGLAVGDYDGDGLVDAYLVSQYGPNRLFRQTAPLHFEDVTTTAGNVDGGKAWGTGATFADVDGDGDLDLYVCNQESKNLLYENQGHGTFRENAAQHGLDLVAASTMAAFADYDRDGSLDLYLLTNRVLSVSLTPGFTSAAAVLPGMQPPADLQGPLTTRLPTFEQLQQLGEHKRLASFKSPRRAMTEVL